MWNYSTILFSEYLFQPFSRLNLLRIKVGIVCNEQQCRVEAVRWVGPRERGDSLKTTRLSVCFEFIWTFCRPFAAARNSRKTRFIWIFCQDKELREWCLCSLSNWRQKQCRADHTKFECKNWKSWARTGKIEMYKLCTIITHIVYEPKHFPK